jgi:hypothetical protein
MALAITDLMILEKRGTNPPDGWKKYPTDLNEGAGGADLFLAYYRDPNKQSQQECITEIFVFRGISANIPAGWEKCDTNLNLGAKTGADELYLLYKRGGHLRPIVGIEIIRKKEEKPYGYEVLDQDLNARAGGADLFLAYLRKNRTLTIGEIKCISPSSGYGGLAKAVVNTSFGAVFGTLGAVAGAPGVLTGPGAAPIIVATAGAGAALGIAIGEAVNAVANDIGSGTKDDVCIRINGAKVWPSNKDGRVEMKSDDHEAVDFVAPFQDDLKITILDKDWLLWVSAIDRVQDILGEMVFTPKASASSTYFFYNADEGSSYVLEIFIDNTSPQLKVTNKTGKDLDVYEETKKLTTLKQNMSKLLPTMDGEFWQFKEANSPTILATYRATDKPDQLVIVPKPQLTIHNKTNETVYVYDPSHQRPTQRLSIGEEKQWPTDPGEVWTFIGERNRVQTYIATEEVAQSTDILMPGITVINKTTSAIEFANRLEPIPLNASATSDIIPTIAGEIWTFKIGDGRVEKYIASSAPLQSIIIEHDKVSYSEEKPNN